jgi:hypothetical protein
MSSDTAYFAGIAAAIAWVVLVSVEFYERIYRKKIEDYRVDLENLGEDALKRLAEDLTIKARKGQPVDGQTIASRHEEVRSLMRGEKVLMSYRKGVFGVLIVTMILVIVAVLYPTTSPLAYGALGATFIAGYIFLTKMLWFDEQIYDVLRQTRESGPILYWFFGTDEKTVVDWRKNIVYAADDAIQDAVNQERVRLVPVVGKTKEEFMLEHHLAEPLPATTVKTQEHLRRLKRLVDDFHDLTFKAETQEKDIRIVRMTDFSARLGVTPSDEEMRLHRESIRIADDFAEAWFDGLVTRLELFIQNPKILNEDSLVELVHEFKRLVFQHYDTVIERSISFVNKFAEPSEMREEKFEEFKTRHNGFAERMRSFEKELTEAGYKLGTGYDIRNISKKMK